MREMRECSCEDWPIQIDKVNAPIMLQSARSGFKWHWDGKHFDYCPWCGKKLVAMNKEVDHEAKESG